jgi:hypothetical protein
VKVCVAPAASVRTSTARRPCSSGSRRCVGSCASAASNTSMWSVAVLEPALPGRSSPVAAPRYAGAVIGVAQQRVKAKGLFPGAGRGLLV